MTLYYVDASRADDTGDGLTVATAKKTIQAAENLSPAAGSIIHVRQGTYRELVTLGVSGSAGNPIEIRGDYTGVIFGDVFGAAPVRITGAAANDQSASRANCITATTKNYRTFSGILFDTSTGALINNSGGTNWIIQQCVLTGTTAGSAITHSGSTQSTCTIQNCAIVNIGNAQGAILISHSVAVDNVAHLIQNCIFSGAPTHIVFTRVGGATIKNCSFIGRNAGIQVAVALTGGQTETVNNCLFLGNSVALNATVAGEITENYNTFFGNATDRTNTNTGANSIAYPPLLDSRLWFQLMYAQAAAQLLSPFDLASYSQLVNLAGTSPTTTDLRAQAIIGAQREWGALEYNVNLGIRDRAARPRYQMGM